MLIEGREIRCIDGDDLESVDMYYIMTCSLPLTKKREITKKTCKIICVMVVDIGSFVRCEINTPLD